MDDDTITIPKSDCNTFMAGQIGPELWATLPDGDKFPKHGVIIWYEDRERAKQALAALMDSK